MKIQDADELKGWHFVLRHKASKKIASRKDQSRKAIQLKALELAESCRGGGIVALLLPKTEGEYAEIETIRNIYKVDRVKARSDRKTGRTDRQLLLAAVENNDLMCRLAIQYDAHLGNKPGPHSTSAKAFVHWLVKGLANKMSPAYRIVSSTAPILLNVNRNARWWVDALKHRRKMQS